jgi:cysteinyl-tRNA synthetase
VWNDPASAPPDEAPAEVAALVEARSAARTARDWARADALRAEIETAGWEVTDTPDGPALTRHGPSPAE